MITTQSSYNAQTKGSLVKAKNSMKKRAGRPKKGAKGGVPVPTIGGMDTLGNLPVGGMMKNPKKVKGKKSSVAPVGRRGKK